ncbi:outer membrane beta-barrel protein [Myxococcus sp. CA039A]|uniref:outer membrane beta-barrel protein n=1 Tax=Myxococcus sp. CA039A TaxID=2741737 RepID=UPI00157A2CE5|nr:outer membrane beta-barrel protein [Myxococcus sp. CA039A]NTX55052.1 outer membrane beta-barrel protein [Myxococcus sp. CA039A]
MKSRTQMMLCSLSFALVASPALAGETFQMQDDSAQEGYSEEGYSSEESAADDSGGGKGFALGLSLGYGAPYGELGSVQADDDDTNKVSDLVTGVIPIQLEAGYFFNPNVYLGATFQYGIASFNDENANCEDQGAVSVSCSASQLRLGVNVAYHFNVTPKIDPWVSVGVGYEFLNTAVKGEQSGESITAKASVKGFEFVAAQVGLDYRISPKFSVGPFATVTAGQYSSTSLSIDSSVEIPGSDELDETEDLETKKIHGFIYGGVRAQYRF